MNEIEALGHIDKALGELEDDDVRLRVLQWAIAKYGKGSAAPAVLAPSPAPPDQSQSETAQSMGASSAASHGPTGSNEIPGIAMISDSGEFKLTVRDPKAKTTNDAAVRLALVAIHSYCQLSGESGASSRRLVKPILENWRAYTGNTRNALASHQGIVRDGDSLSLDQHAKREAEEYISQILDDEVQGAWNPNSVAKRKRKRATPQDD